MLGISALVFMVTALAAAEASDQKKEIRMEPQIKKCPEFVVVGLKALRDYGKQGNEGELWGQMGQYFDSLASVASLEYCYGVNAVISKDSTARDVFDYYAAVKLTSPGSAVSAPLGKLAIPQLQYAEFSFPFKAMEESIKYASKQWLPQSGYVRDESAPIYDFVRFPGKTDGNSIVMYAIPVKKKHGH